MTNAVLSLIDRL